MLSFSLGSTGRVAPKYRQEIQLSTGHGVASSHVLKPAQPAFPQKASTTGESPVQREYMIVLGPRALAMYNTRCGSIHRIEMTDVYTVRTEPSGKRQHTFDPCRYRCRVALSSKHTPLHRTEEYGLHLRYAFENLLIVQACLVSHIHSNLHPDRNTR